MKAECSAGRDLLYDEVSWVFRSLAFAMDMGAVIRCSATPAYPDSVAREVLPRCTPCGMNRRLSAVPHRFSSPVDGLTFQRAVHSLVRTVLIRAAEEEYADAEFQGASTRR